MERSVLTVRDLRRQWKPHKERLAQLRENHPTAIRFHRAASWLDSAAQAEAASQLDQALMLRWTAFNALYGQWDVELREPVADRACWSAFLERILALDQAQRMVSMLQNEKPLVLSILEDPHLARHFWRDLDAADAAPARRDRQRWLRLFADRHWWKIAEPLVERIYLLRCQLVHGAASCSSQLNRTAVQHCQTMLGWLLTTILQIWIEQGAEEDWGIMCYPPVPSTFPRRNATNSAAASRLNSPR
jgi:hypothetical protein